MKSIRTVVYRRFSYSASFFFFFFFFGASSSSPPPSSSSPFFFFFFFFPPSSAQRHQLDFQKTKFVTGFSRWVKGQAQGLEPGGFKLWVTTGFSLYSPASSPPPAGATAPGLGPMPIMASIGANMPPAGPFPFKASITIFCIFSPPGT
jgi:hypothetical protein